ncbi:MAG: DUF86 domain-containing protein [Actinomycetota bacterium]|nr:DUF86 domain-containing protein [Actinomycetota bacterium]MDQ3680701.1 DUF86 domain-containing protein [Actinomycetota bacterium]
MVDERRVRRLLQRVSEDLAYLTRRAQEDPATQLGDVERMAALKYVFVTAIEGCLDTAQHLCASEGWGPPASNAEAFRLMARHGVVPGELAEAMAAAVGFRNVLVHGYVDVDDRRVVAFLDRVGQLEEYVSVVSGWVGRQT